MSKVKEYYSYKTKEHLSEFVGVIDADIVALEKKIAELETRIKTLESKK